jgi:predicted metalloprotease with PDZ domain
MKDDFEATLIVDLAPAEVWQALTRRTIGRDGNDSEKHYVLPGFPSIPPLEIEGASCTVLEEQPERLLIVKKDDHPCLGTEIAVRLEQTETGTRITVVQSGFGPFLDFAGHDTVFGHGMQIMADFQLYLERGLTVPGTVWAPDLGAKLKQTPVGLEVVSPQPGGFADRVGIRAGDLLLTLSNIRLHDLQQLWTVLALTDPAANTPITWARANKSITKSAKRLP